MEDFVRSGRIADLVLLVIAVEAAALLLWRRRRGGGSSLARILPFLAAAAFLVLALRLALTGGPWQAIAAALGLGGLAHLAGLRPQR